MENIIIHTDKKSIDVNFVHQFITRSYWAKGRTINEMQTCIDHSLNFGVYLDTIQIGYARVVTDTFQFAYLMDLFIDDKYRGKGYAVKLMETIMNFESLKNIKVWRLATTDAHALYEKFGFKQLANPEKIMEKIRA